MHSYIYKPILFNTNEILSKLFLLSTLFLTKQSYIDNCQCLQHTYEFF